MRCVVYGSTTFCSGRISLIGKSPGSSVSRREGQETLTASLLITFLPSHTACPQPRYSRFTYIPSFCSLTLAAFSFLHLPLALSYHPHFLPTFYTVEHPLSLSAFQLHPDLPHPPLPDPGFGKRGNHCLLTLQIYLLHPHALRRQPI